MSMELYAFSDKYLNSVAEWQRAIDAEDFALKLASDVDLATTSGFLPARLDGEPVGFECYRDNADDLMEELGDIIDLDRSWVCALGFRWLGSNVSEWRAAWMAATAYARATNGVVVDPEEGRLLRPDEACKAILDFERNLPGMQAMIENTRRESPT